MADSVKDAFGVQKEVPVYETPMGTSIIAQHFSPAPTEPTPLEEVKQTVTQLAKNLKLPEEEMKKLEQQIMEEKLKEIDNQSYSWDLIHVQSSF